MSFCLWIELCSDLQVDPLHVLILIFFAMLGFS